MHAAKSERGVNQYDGEKEYTATVRVSQLGERFAAKRVLVRRYLMDSAHSTPELGRLEKVGEATVAHDGSITQDIRLEKNALCLVELIPADD